MRSLKSRRSFSLYKKETKSGLVWYARFWDESRKRYGVSRSTGVPVEGKRERRYEAEQAAKLILPNIHFTPRILIVEMTVGVWLEKFTAFENNPRAARLIGEGAPYSPATIEVYRGHYNRYLKNDPLMAIKMADVEEGDVLVFQGRLGYKEKLEHCGGGKLAGTRTYEIVLRFVRMAFHEYWLEHPGWPDPFSRLKAPKTKKARQRDVIGEDEFNKLFAPGIIPDPLDRAVCAAMYWAGLRRSEIWGLKPEYMDWNIPKINLNHAWKNYGRKIKELGDPKWHKIREVPFPVQLQRAIKDLWAAYGAHEFVFTRTDGTQPSANYISRHLPEWLEAAGIKLEGRKIVPHSARHSLASALENDGVPIRYIQDLLGHSDYTTTKGYLRTVDGAIKKISQTLGGEKTEKSKTLNRSEETA
jgi:integrase